ncbi:helix-turn-helix domain-containing protein [Streptomyces niveus]|uniref:helix-turn-helix domain-containing protein n=1 Tax=Streptomyces niveus TaxID=193462 RepID=UPI0003C63DE4|nr:helix-turn-helix transcriptional regulator [Streptomyces niveus]EST22821.1 hypothetical protein M877_29020 [Streptomyces niveus NCIMB 11891]
MAYRLSITKLRDVARRKGDHSGYAIARRTGLHESTVSRLLRGQQQPGANTLFRLRDAYGGDLADFVDTVDEPSARTPHKRAAA